MRHLVGEIRPYPWGSRHALAALSGRPVPSPGPEAELWLGAHPSAPARLDTAAGPVLPELIGDDPAGTLGGPVRDRFGARLPYLLKVLAADAPLSVQAHPDAARARAAFDAGRPGYVDPYHKPELLVAVTHFDALCGFREPTVSADLLDGLGVPGLRPVVAVLRAGSTAQRLRGAVAALLDLPDRRRAELVEQVAATGQPLAARLAAAHPGDLGVLLALLLNEVRLAPDEAVFMPAGIPHAYLGGVGVEIMAASDNVIRGGLTGKPVDGPELLRVLRPEVLATPVRRPRTLAPGLLAWPVPVPDFALHKAMPGGGSVALPGGGPRVVACLGGTVTVRCGAQELMLTGGRAVFLRAGEPSVGVAGTGAVFQASVPE